MVGLMVVVDVEFDSGGDGGSSDNNGGIDSKTRTQKIVYNMLVM